MTTLSAFETSCAVCRSELQNDITFSPRVKDSWQRDLNSNVAFSLCVRNSCVRSDLKNDVTFSPGIKDNYWRLTSLSCPICWLAVRIVHAERNCQEKPIVVARWLTTESCPFCDLFLYRVLLRNRITICPKVLHYCSLVFTCAKPHCVCVRVCVCVCVCVRACVVRACVRACVRGVRGVRAWRACVCVCVCVLWMI